MGRVFKDSERRNFVLLVLTSLASCLHMSPVAFLWRGIPLVKTVVYLTPGHDGGSISQGSNLYKMPSVMPEDFANTTQIYNTRSVVASSRGRKMNPAAMATMPHRNRAIVFSKSAPRAKSKGARSSYLPTPSSPSQSSSSRSSPWSRSPCSSASDCQPKWKPPGKP